MWRIVSSLVIVLVLVPTVYGLHAQEFPVRNLGASDTVVGGERIAYSLWESTDGVDLNDDGDLDDAVVHIERIGSNEVVNLGLAGEAQFVSEDWVLLQVDEDDQGSDLNDDGDTDDLVPHAVNLGTLESRRLSAIGFPSALQGDWAVVVIQETELGEDLNGDGDTDDPVPSVHNLLTQESRTLDVGGVVQVANPDWFTIVVWERREGEDLNGDGDQGDFVVHAHGFSSGETINLELASAIGALSGDVLAVLVSEFFQNEDLNGDGDRMDLMIVAYDLAQSSTINTITSPGRLGGPARTSDTFLTVADADGGMHLYDISEGETTALNAAGLPEDFNERWIAYRVLERFGGEDLNGDGDLLDEVLHVYDFELGRASNLALAVRFQSTNLSGDWLVASVRESDQGQDLNDDGDLDDHGVRIHRLGSGEAAWLPISGPRRGFIGDQFILSFSEFLEQEDFNSDGNLDDLIDHLVDLSSVSLGGLQLPGDCNQDGTLDLSDAVCLFGVLFLGQPAEFPCGDGSPNDPGNIGLLDWQQDATVDLSDGIGILQHLFGGGPGHPLGTVCAPLAGCSPVCGP